MKTKIITADNTLHRIIEAKGGMFDVSNHNMEQNIGKHVKFKNPRCLIEREIFTIEGIQRIYTGEISYRVFSDSCNIEHPTQVDSIEFI